jgi:hypothetical protein
MVSFYSLFPAVLLPALVYSLPRGGSGQHSNRRYQLLTEETNYTVFEHDDTGVKLQYVTNSGICETTPGVNQYSGYLSTGKKPLRAH